MQTKIHSNLLSAFFTLFLLSLGSGAFAQNWALLNSSRNYSFAKDTIDFEHLETIRVLSSSGTAGDSTFELNRMFIPFSFNSAVVNLPNFLQRSCSLLPNGDWHFYDTSAFVIRPLALMGESWLFDTTNAVTATMGTSYVQSIFGNSDSLKQILLSSGDTIIVSKDHGIIQFSRSYLFPQKYYLSGMENPTAGITIPRFDDFYNLHAGDELQFLSTFSHMTHSVYSTFSNYYYYKCSVFSSVKTNDTLHLELGIMKKSIVWTGYGNPPAFSFSSYTLNLDLIDSVNSYLNKYNFEQTQIAGSEKNIRLYTDTSFHVNGKHIDGNYRPDAADTLYANIPPSDWYYEDYATGFGLVHSNNYSYDMSSTANVQDSVLSGCVINGLQTGTLHPDSFFVDAVPELAGNDFILFPNPCNDKTNVFLPQYGICEISIYDELSNQLLIQPFEKQISISTSGFARGVYFYEIRKEGKLLRNGKFVKQ